MKRKNLLLTFLLAALILGGVTKVWAYDFSAENEGQTIYYNIIDAENHYVEVTYNTDSYDSYVGAIVVPSTVTHDDVVYTVTAVGESAFRRSTTYASTGRVTSVSLPNTVTSIGDHAFRNGGSYLLLVNIPDNVNNIGEYAFAFCTAITSITIPDAVEEIKTYAFNSCSGLTSITIPDNVETIRSYAFSSCSNVTSITIGLGLKTLESNAFTSCSKLTSLTYNATNVTTVGNNNIWSSPTNNCTLTIGPDVESIPNYVFRGLSKVATLYYNATSSSDYTAGTYGNIWPTFTSPWTLVIGDNVTRIPAYIFRYKSGLQSLTIPSSVTSIGADAFENTALSQVIIPSTVTSIENYAFKNISSLTTVIMMRTTPPTAGSLVFLKSSSTSYSDANMPNIYVLSGNVDENKTILEAYKEAANWSTWANKISYVNTDLTITSPMTIPSGGILDMGEHSLTIGESGSLTIADGGQLICNNAVEATIQKNITHYTVEENQDETKTDGWYFIASPVSYNPDGTNLLSNTYDLFLYDEEQVMWRNYEQAGAYHHFSMEPAKGYLYANSVDTELSFAGLMPACTTNVAVNLSYSSGASMPGFNLVGNPFTNNLTSNVTIGGNPLSAYSYVEGGSEILSTTLADRAIKPAEGFLVQATDEDQKLIFNPSSKGETATKPSFIRIEAGDEDFMDRAYVQIGSGNTLRKMTINDNVSHVYVMSEGKDYAAATIQEAQGEMPVNFKAAKNGQYTITVNPENVEMDYLHLVDNLTGADIDLLSTPSYTFNAKTTDYASRFRLLFAANGIEENGTSTSSATFAFISNGQLIVNGTGTLQIIDMTGRVVSTKSTEERIGTNELTPGVYVVKLIGNETKTQKIVIE